MLCVAEKALPLISSAYLDVTRHPRPVWSLPLLAAHLQTLGPALNSLELQVIVRLVTVDSAGYLEWALRPPGWQATSRIRSRKAIAELRGTVLQFPIPIGVSRQDFG
jgi:hypothetical protein